MGLLYEVGDIVTLKKTHPCGSKDWEILRVGADLQAEMYRMRPPDHGAAEDGGEKYQESAEKITRSMTQRKLK